MKFKVGDQVRILKARHNCGAKFVGKIAKITKYTKSWMGVPCYDIDIDNGEYNWFDDELELVEEEKSMKFKVGDKVEIIGGVAGLGGKGYIIKIDDNEPITCRVELRDGVCFDKYPKNLKLITPTPKSLLKDGVVATFKYGERGILFRGEFLNSNEVESEITDYEDDLTTSASEWNIIKLEFDGEVIWEREEELLRIPTEEYVKFFEKFGYKAHFLNQTLDDAGTLKISIEVEKEKYEEFKPECSD